MSLKIQVLLSTLITTEVQLSPNTPHCLEKMTSLFGGSSPSPSSVVSAVGNAGIFSFESKATGGSFTHSSEMEKRKQQIIQEMRSEAALVMAQNFINVRYSVLSQQDCLF